MSSGTCKITIKQLFQNYNFNKKIQNKREQTNQTKITKTPTKQKSTVTPPPWICGVKIMVLTNNPKWDGFSMISACDIHAHIHFIHTLIDHTLLIQICLLNCENIISYNISPVEKMFAPYIRSRRYISLLPLVLWRLSSMITVFVGGIELVT